jgi:maltooligosyltrehalose trehalohydrolase
MPRRVQTSDHPHSLPSWRRLPIGAEPTPDGGVHFRVWAPLRQSVDVVCEPQLPLDGAPVPIARTPLEREPQGYFSGLVPNASIGTLYRYRLDDGDEFPDPASRWQPEGPHGPSAVVDPDAFTWSDTRWQGPVGHSPVIYELHVGTFTQEGTWEAAERELPPLAELGITLIELMPVSDFAGRFGWGYDGVDLFAPTRLYGTPGDFRRFVDCAHSLGMGVILDVVYNHLGPDGNYLTRFADSYYSTRYTTDWGEAFHFEGASAAPVREFVLANARYWIDEFHLDGLRLDATQNMYDASPRHIIADVTTTVRAAAKGRATYLVAENEPQHVRCVAPVEEDGHGLDAMWNDDWHHSAMVALTGRDEAYYADYAGRASEFVAAARHGFLYQGQWYAWQAQSRGTSSRGMPPHRFVHFLQNHDQIANSFRGDRLQRLASPARGRALTALLLLGPQTPMLFQGQEFGASAPFQYFADHHADLIPLVRQGRTKFLTQFQSIAALDDPRSLADPGDHTTFERCKLDHTERERNAPVYALHRDLLALRRTDPTIRQARDLGVDGAVLRDDAFVLRYFGDNGDDRLLLVNLGGPLHLSIVPEPLLAPPSAGGWRLRWSSEAPAYGGLGTPALSPTTRDWCIPGQCALVLEPAAAAPTSRERADV